jgi:hypothetical protein
MYPCMAVDYSLMSAVRWLCVGAYLVLGYWVLIAALSIIAILTAGLWWMAAALGHPLP